MPRYPLLAMSGRHRNGEPLASFHYPPPKVWRLPQPPVSLSFLSLSHELPAPSLLAELRLSPPPPAPQPHRSPQTNSWNPPASASNSPGDTLSFLFSAPSSGYSRVSPLYLSLWVKSPPSHHQFLFCLTTRLSHLWFPAPLPPPNLPRILPVSLTRAPWPPGACFPAPTPSPGFGGQDSAPPSPGAPPPLPATPPTLSALAWDPSSASPRIPKGLAAWFVFLGSPPSPGPGTLPPPPSQGVGAPPHP